MLTSEGRRIWYLHEPRTKLKDKQSQRSVLRFQLLAKVAPHFYRAREKVQMRPRCAGMGVAGSARPVLLERLRFSSRMGNSWQLSGDDGVGRRGLLHARKLCACCSKPVTDKNSAPAVRRRIARSRMSSSVFWFLRTAMSSWERSECCVCIFHIYALFFLPHA